MPGDMDVRVRDKQGKAVMIDLTQADRIDLVREVQGTCKDLNIREARQDPFVHVSYDKAEAILDAVLAKLLRLGK